MTQPAENPFYNDMIQLMNSGRSGIAAGELREHLAAHPTDDYARFLYGSASYKVGNYATAERVFRELCSKPGALPVHHYSLGISLEQLGRIPEAVGAVEECIRLDANFPGADKKLHELRQRTGLASRPTQQQRFQRANQSLKNPGVGSTQGFSPSNRTSFPTSPPGPKQQQSAQPKRGVFNFERYYGDGPDHEMIPVMANPRRLKRVKWYLGLVWMSVAAIGVIVWIIFVTGIIGQINSTRNQSNENEKFACEQAQKAGLPIPPGCAKYGIP